MAHVHWTEYLEAIAESYLTTFATSANRHPRTNHRIVTTSDLINLGCLYCGTSTIFAGSNARDDYTSEWPSPFRPTSTPLRPLRCCCVLNVLTCQKIRTVRRVVTEEPNGARVAIRYSW